MVGNLSSFVVSSCLSRNLVSSCLAEAKAPHWRSLDMVERMLDAYKL